MLKDQLKYFREKKGLTKKQVADGVGVSERAYIAYEYGERDVSTDTLIKLAKFFGVTVDCLLGLEPQKDPFADLNLCKEDEQAVIDKYMSLPASVRAVLLDVLRQLGGEITQEEIDEIALGNREDTESKGDADLTV